MVARTLHGAGNRYRCHGNILRMCVYANYVYIMCMHVCACMCVCTLQYTIQVLVRMCVCVCVVCMACVNAMLFLLWSGYL